MRWLSDAERLRAARRPAILITVIAGRGHAPREAGAKMLVAGDELLGTIGGGNLEMIAVERAREMLAAMGEQDAASQPETLQFRLNDKESNPYGRQCCGGEMTVLLEPLPVPPAVAVFGVGNVGMELARILSRHELDLHVADSRAEHLEQLHELEPAVARVFPHRAVLGEAVVAELPEGAHVLIMTHDHAEDLHLCDAALRHPALGSIGLIGSRAKWSRFRKKLIEEGHAPDLVDTIRCPIGLPEVAGKHPAVIAVSVAAALLSSAQ